MQRNGAAPLLSERLKGRGIMEKTCSNKFARSKIYVKNWDGQDVSPCIDCDACHGTGVSYWSDDYYGSCMECCFFNCNGAKMEANVLAG